MTKYLWNKNVPCYQNVHILHRYYINTIFYCNIYIIFKCSSSIVMIDLRYIVSHVVLYTFRCLRKWLKLAYLQERKLKWPTWPQTLMYRTGSQRVMQCQQPYLWIPWLQLHKYTGYTTDTHVKFICELLPPYWLASLHRFQTLYM